MTRERKQRKASNHLGNSFRRSRSGDSRHGKERRWREGEKETGGAHLRVRNGLNSMGKRERDRGHGCNAGTAATRARLQRTGKEGREFVEAEKVTEGAGRCKGRGKTGQQQQQQQEEVMPDEVGG